jgi:hypothetical protein
MNESTYPEIGSEWETTHERLATWYASVGNKSTEYPDPKPVRVLDVDRERGYILVKVCSGIGFASWIEVGDFNQYYRLVDQVES